MFLSTGSLEARRSHIDRAPVAQWIEHQTTDLGVTGSSPVGRTTQTPLLSRLRRNEITFPFWMNPLFIKKWGQPFFAAPTTSLSFFSSQPLPSLFWGPPLLM
jgi:hypothetical protein